MFAEDDLLPISALQHLLFCERQCALIHLERLWAENRYTVEGRLLHARADAGKAERRKPRPHRQAEDGHEHAEGGRGGPADPVPLRIARSVPLRSLRLGLFGVADVVEFRRRASPSPGGVDCRPVEYKRGRPKSHDADRVQLCAQALCLEEMLGTAVPAGALFYGRTRRRLDVVFDAPLRAATEAAAARLHAMAASGRTPPATYEAAKCGRCSLIHLCLPAAPARAASYLDRSIARALAGPPPAGAEP